MTREICFDRLWASNTRRKSLFFLISPICFFTYYGPQYASTVSSFFPLSVEEEADVAQGDAAVLKVNMPSFVTRRVSQTSDAPGARNNITLVIQAKILKRPLQ